MIEGTFHKLDLVNFAVALVPDETITQFKVYPIVAMTSQVYYIEDDDADRMMIGFSDTDFMLCMNVPKELVNHFVSAMIWNIPQILKS